MSEAAQGDVSLRLTDLSRRFGATLALDDVTLTVPQGEFVAIIGPSGSGKTTLLRTIGGFETPDAGRVELGGRDVTALPPERRDVATVFQSYALFPHLSVLDNVMFGPRMAGTPRGERVRRARGLLDLVRLGDVGDRRPAQLSGGMQQRVALARALATDPSVLLFDEPLAALDRQLREELQGELRRVHRALGKTFVYITHDQREAFGMADRLAVMRAGRIVQTGRPSELYDRPVDLWTATFVGAANLLPGVLQADGRTFAVDGGPEVRTRVADAVPGEPAVALVRPEHTAIGPVGSVRTAHRIPARLIEAVSTGPDERLLAATASGVEVAAVHPRTGTVSTMTPGDEVEIGFDDASLAFSAAAGAAART